MLLSLFEATVHEGMVVAEILLYTALNRKLTHHSYLDSHGECAEFAAWKRKWCHLFALPRSSAFKLSYHSAYLILAVRSLEDFDSGPTRDLLSLEQAQPPSPHPLSSRTTQPQAAHHHHHHPHATALRFAVQILETFLEMSGPLRDEIPIYLHMCISYSALVIAQYWRPTNREVPAAATVLELLGGLEEWCAGCRSGSVVTAHSVGLARRRVLLADGVPPPGQEDGGGLGGGVGKQGRVESVEAASPLYSAAEGLLGLGGGGMVEGSDARGAAAGVGGHHGHVHLDVGELGLDLTPDFPSMEDFFGGGFLDFMR